MMQQPNFNPILALQLILDLYGQIVNLQQQLQQVAQRLSEAEKKQRQSPEVSGDEDAT